MAEIINNRHLRFFLSSTFQDMEEERNHLIRNTFPKIREMALKYGATITELDLRWGITDDESRLGQVLQICLKEVENSIPFFIGMVGNRYGWTPDLNDINEESIENYPEVPAYIAQGMSITEMEMEYGALGREEDVNAIFFITDEEPTKDICGENYEKLLSLREKIINNGRYPVFTYKSPGDIGNVIEEYIQSILNYLFGESDNTPHEQETELQLRYCQAQAAQYIPISSQSDFLSDWLSSPSRASRILLVKGDKGSGKSALLSYWVQSLCGLNEEDILIIPTFVGHGNNHGSGVYIKTHILKTLKQYINEDESTNDSTNLENSKFDIDKEIENALKKTRKYCFIIIDGIDKISNNEKESFFKWINAGIPPRITIICSSSSDDAITKYLVGNGADIIEIASLDSVQKEYFIREYLAERSKKLNDSDSKSIVQSPLFGNVLALKTMLDTLVLFSKHTHLQNDIQTIMEASTSAKAFYQTILSIYEDEFDAKIVGDVLSYIVVSKHGLLDNEIISICNIIPLEWSQLLLLLRPFFSVEQGRYSINHDIIKEAIETKYLENDICLVNQRKLDLIAFFEGLEESTTALYELPFLYKDVNQMDNLYSHLIRPEVLDIFIERNILAFSSFWKTVHKSTNYRITDYLEKMSIKDSESINVLGYICFNHLNDNKASELFFKEYYKRGEDAQKKFDDLFKVYFNDDSPIGYLETMPEHLRHSGSFCSMGDIKYEEGKYDEALRLYHRALGFIGESDDMYNIESIREKSKHVELFYYRDNEYYRVAYAFSKLGIAYDEIDKKDIACIMYERALQYLEMCEEDHRSLLAEIYHNYAISLEDRDATKTICLFEAALDINKYLLGQHHPSIARTLCSMGAVCADKLNMPQKALECYNSGIEIQEKMNREDRILADLYCNRSKVMTNLELVAFDIKHAIAIYQNLHDLVRIEGAYQMLAYSYFDKEVYESAFLYYLISFWFSFYNNPCSENTLYLKGVVEDLSMLFANSSEKLSSEVQSLFVSFIGLYNKTDDTQIENEFMVGAKIGELAQLMSQSSDLETNNEIFRRIHFILMETRAFCHDFNHLPNLDDSMIEFLLSFIGINEAFNHLFYDFFDSIGISGWLNNEYGKILQWEGICMAMYLKHSVEPQDSNSLMLPLEISCGEFYKSEQSGNSILPRTLHMLNSFIYDVHIPTGNLKNAEKTIDSILIFEPNNELFLDSKAEILFRKGQIKDAVDFVKQVIAIDSTFYPEGNEYLYNKISKYL